jgi:hypothetical protein
MTDDPSSLPVTSSNPPDMTPEELETYKDLLRALSEARIPFAVAGAFALHKHTGIWRRTKDLDVVLEASRIPDAFAVLEKAAFKTHIEDPVWLAKAVRGEYFVDLITSLGNAVLVVDATWIERSTPYRIMDVPCNVMGAEEILASKIFVSRRERFDGADVAHLILCCAERLDWERLEHLMRPHWEMLLWSLVFFAYVYPARVDLVPESVWEGLLERFQKRLKRPQKNEPFRGTLIDPNMFAIDVSEWGERDLFREYCADHPFLVEAVSSKNRSKE